MLSLSCPKNCYFIHFGISVLEQNKNHLYGIWFLTCFKSVSKIFTMKSLFWCTDTFSDHNCKIILDNLKIWSNNGQYMTVISSTEKWFWLFTFFGDTCHAQMKAFVWGFPFFFPSPLPPHPRLLVKFLKDSCPRSFRILYKILDKILMNILNDPWMVLTRAKLKL